MLTYRIKPWLALLLLFAFIRSSSCEYRLRYFFFFFCSYADWSCVPILLYFETNNCFWHFELYNIMKVNIIYVIKMRWCVLSVVVDSWMIEIVQFIWWYINSFNYRCVFVGSACDIVPKSFTENMCGQRLSWPSLICIW